MGKRLESAKKEVDAMKKYPLDEAIALAKKTATTKFIGNVSEFNLWVGNGKGNTVE